MSWSLGARRTELSASHGASWPSSDAVVGQRTGTVGRSDDCRDLATQGGQFLLPHGLNLVPPGPERPILRTSAHRHERALPRPTSGRSGILILVEYLWDGHCGVREGL